MNSVTPINLQKVAYLKNNQTQSSPEPNVAGENKPDSYVPSFRGYQRTLENEKGIKAFFVLCTTLITGFLAKYRAKNDDTKGVQPLDNGVKETNIIEEPVSDVDNMGIADLKGIKVVQQPVPSLREHGYVGFMYKGKPHVAEFYSNYEAEIKVAILKELRNIDPKSANDFNDKILSIVGKIGNDFNRIPLSNAMICKLSDLDGKGDSYLDKNTFDERVAPVCYPRSDIEGTVFSNWSNVKVIQAANPSLRENGYAVFMLNGIPEIISFYENNTDSVEKRIQQKVSGKKVSDSIQGSNQTISGADLESILEILGGLYNNLYNCDINNININSVIAAINEKRDEINNILKEEERLIRDYTAGKISPEEFNKAISELDLGKEKQVGWAK